MRQNIFRKGLVFLLASVLHVSGQPAAEPTLWLIDPAFAVKPALLVGARGDLVQWDAWEARGALLAGLVDYGGGIVHPEIDGELGLSRSTGLLSGFGVGLRGEMWGDSEFELGPMLSARFDRRLGDAWRGHVDAAWMFLGLMGDYDSEHLCLELGTTWAKGRWWVLAGYRHKFYYNREQDPGFSGPILGLWRTFGGD